jgi:hypothetical protein
MKSLTMSTVTTRSGTYSKLMARLRLSALAVAGGVVAALSPLMSLTAFAAAYPTGGTLSSDTDVKTWTGIVIRGNIDPTISIPECRRNDCDLYQLKIALPPDTWVNNTGGVRVTISWLNPQPDDNVFMYIYKNGVKIAQSTNPGGTSQTVLLPTPGKGLYNVYAAYKSVPGSPNTSLFLGYDGNAHVEYTTPPAPLVPELPVVPPVIPPVTDPGPLFLDPRQPRLVLPPAN